MNNKIGKKIKSTLKKKNISVDNFSSMMKVDSNEVQDWIEGKKIPGHKHLVKICSILDLDINKLVDITEINIFLEKKNTIIKICVSIIILLVISTITFMYMFNKSKKVKDDFNMYEFYASGDYFRLKNGTFFNYNDERYIQLSDIEIKEELDIKSLNINISFNDKVWAITEYKKVKDGDLKTWLKAVKFEEFAHPEKSADSFANYDFSMFPGNMKIEINYCLTTNECSIDMLHIKGKKIESNNRLK